MQQPAPPYGAPQAPGPGYPPPQAAAPPSPLIYPMHGGAKLAYNIVGVLLVLLVITIPFAIWVFIGTSRARLELTGNELISRAFLTKRWSLPNLRRLGVVTVPIVARGIGGALARKKVGGREGVNLCAIDDRNRKLKLLVSMYDRYPELINNVSHMTRLPVETLRMGAFGVKWP